MSKKRIAIAGGGIAGLAAAFYLAERLGDRAEIRLYEKERRLGGTIGTTREEGYLVDWGPNGFLDREPLTLEFIDKIGLTADLYRANDNSNKRFIFRKRRLREISANPVKFMTGGLLSIPGRLRILREYFVPPRGGDGDESVFDFAARRIGREAAEMLIDPMVSGIFGGDARQLSLGACFPVMEKMERDYGGLIKALLARKKEKKGATQKGGPAGPSGHLTSFRGGLYTLVERLEQHLRAVIETGNGLNRIKHNPDGTISLKLDDGERVCDYLILAVPSFIAGRILTETAPEASDLLQQIPYSNLAVVAQGYRREDISRPLDGFGFLVPHNQKRRILGSIWTSIIFPEQAPDGSALFRTMLGGALDNQIVEESRDHLAEIAHRELSDIMGITGAPSFTRIFVWKKAIPQYVLGHRERLQRIYYLVNRLESIYLAGNAYTGIGLNETIKRSASLAGDIIRHMDISS